MNHHDRRRRRTRPQYRQRGYRRPAHNVPVNIADHGEHFVARVYAIGFGREDIRVQVEGDTMYISGQRTPAAEPPEFLLQEFPVRHFERSFQLSEHADRQAITARVDEAGVLEITVPKLPSARAETVEVAVE